jgi:beta-ureidopropionase
VCVGNKAGTEILESQETFCYGNSAIIDPTGKLAVKAGDDQEEVIIHDADLEQVTTTRLMLPLFRARRPHLYDQITKED